MKNTYGTRGKNPYPASADVIPFSAIVPDVAKAWRDAGSQRPPWCATAPLTWVYIPTIPRIMHRNDERSQSLIF